MARRNSYFTYLLFIAGILVVAFLVNAFLTNPAAAQNFNAVNSQSDSAAAAQSGSQSGAGATAAIIVNQAAQPATQRITNDSRVTYGYAGEYRARIESVPDAYAPSLAGGNPCQMSASVGGSVVGFGISGGAAWTDEDCEVRQETALLGNMYPGDRTLALKHFCLHSERVAKTLASQGYADCLLTAAARPALLCADGSVPDARGACPGDDLSAKGKGRIVPAAAAGIPPAPAATLARIEATVARCDRIDEAGFCWKD